ncbi:nucleolar protein [Tanacetum coccineum]
MRTQFLSVWTLLKLLSLGYASYNDFAFPIDLSPLHNYTRLTEIENHCSSFISSASELEVDDNRASRLKNELSFFNGDWEQDSHGSPLMPFDDSDMPYATSSYISPWKVVSFEVQNVTSCAPHQPKNTVSINGVLSVGITRNSTIISEPYLMFHKMPGMSTLKVNFEGLYLETKENGGERLICLLGNSTFPFKKVPTRFSEEYMELYFSARDTTYNEEPVILPHDQILLVLKYLKTPALSTYRIQGEMTSLHENQDFEFFDKVHITSHSSISLEDQISIPDELIVESFDQNPLKDAILEDGVNKFNNSELCRILKYFEHEEYMVMPNLKLGGQNWFQDTVGPFLLGNEIQLVDRNNQILRVIFHKITCHEEKVSGVLRMYPSTIKPHVAGRRTGLSTLTLSVKGKWNSSTGLLSMLGCLGPTLVRCDSGVLLYFPKSFSSKQRSLVSGSIFSLKSAPNYFHPVFIGLEMLSPGLQDGGWYSRTYASYNYTKGGLAIHFKGKIQEPPRLLSYIMELIFRYPFVEEREFGTFNMSNHSGDDLKIDTFTSSETFVKVEVLSLGPLFKQNANLLNGGYNHELHNISMNLLIIEAPKKVKEESYRHVSRLYLEGVYDQRVGKLYLIGCRKVDFDHVDLERGLDCRIEVTIEYSPINTRWLINPSAKISIVSQRNKEDDYYYFKPIHLHTFMMQDTNHEENVVFRKIFEGYFQVFLLLVYISHLFNQIKYMKKSHEPVPYISLLMPGFWILGYGITIIYSEEILIMSSETQGYKKHPYDLQNYKRYLTNLDYLARFLVLVSMFQMGIIFVMVLKARKVLRAQGVSPPSEKKVITVSLICYMCYLLLRIIEGWIRLHLAEVTITRDDYVKLIVMAFWYTLSHLQDYYMIPQIVAHCIWKKPRLNDPLLKYFFTGLWIPALLQFVYEAVRNPVVAPFDIVM